MYENAKKNYRLGPALIRARGSDRDANPGVTGDDDASGCG